MLNLLHDILEEFSEAQSIADRITPEAQLYRFTLKRRAELRQAQARWRSFKPNYDKLKLWMKAYYQKPEVRTVRLAYEKKRMQNPAVRAKVQEYKRNWKLSRRQSMGLTSAVSKTSQH